MKIAKEGIKVVVLLGAITVVLFYFTIVGGIVASTFLGFALYFFRDPERNLPDGIKEGAIVSPADGKIIKVEELKEDLFVHQKMKKVSIFMSLFDVHVNRSPVDGRVVDVRHVDGMKVPAYREDSSEINERNYLLLEKGSLKFLVVQVAGVVARRIRCSVGVGDFLTRGQRFGMIILGSRVDVYMPPSAEIKVSVGDRVSAGKSILAEMGEGGEGVDEDKEG